MLEKTIRELAGEIWAEIEQESRDAALQWSPIVSINSDAVNRIMDIVMGVLARHDNSTLVNDKDMPVEPLRKQFIE